MSTKCGPTRWPRCQMPSASDPSMWARKPVKASRAVGPGASCTCGKFPRPVAWRTDKGTCCKAGTPRSGFLKGQCQPHPALFQFLREGREEHDTGGPVPRMGRAQLCGLGPGTPHTDLGFVTCQVGWTAVSVKWPSAEGMRTGSLAPAVTPTCHLGSPAQSRSSSAQPAHGWSWHLPEWLSHHQAGAQGPTSSSQASSMGLGPRGALGR